MMMTDIDEGVIKDMTKNIDEVQEKGMIHIKEIIDKVPETDIDMTDKELETDAEGMKDKDIRQLQKKWYYINTITDT